ncbi:phospholipase/carboxylesterase [Marinobacterium nitratireducens]|uniref:Phospholipase/carboxylesterase n=1 Tax=Marinobacterium nitratireducens TaxID=518897 RepID=A0A917ZPV1_9GAMM|nr:carboxylesterase [Marinobacterium nitratireducens]GGO86854.1 phospholipase/carboxylesterase [Marinobacterium nitratireducens]
MKLELQTLEPADDACASVIWLHGLGADGSDFVPAVPLLELPGSLPVRFLFPNAPVRPVTVNGGWPMPAWYDILEMNIERRIDEASLDESAQQIGALIEQELERGIPAERIFLFGFSQGGAVAYHTALRYPSALGGVVALSTYLASAARMPQELHPSNAGLPMLVCHGSADDVVPITLGRRAIAELQRLGLAPQWQEYPIAHEVCVPELNQVGRWLAAQLQRNSR